jgi:translation initiation factor 3 subunit C
MAVKVWNLLPDSQHVRRMLAQKIKEEALKAFIFAYGTNYDCLSLQRLAEQFQLNADVVYALVSRMIMEQEIYASIDQPTGTVAIQHNQPNRLQQMSLMYCEKLSAMVESNEKSFELKFQQLQQTAQADQVRPKRKVKY